MRGGDHSALWGSDKPRLAKFLTLRFFSPKKRRAFCHGQDLGVAINSRLQGVLRFTSIILYKDLEIKMTGYKCDD